MVSHVNIEVVNPAWAGLRAGLISECEYIIIIIIKYIIAEKMKNFALQICKSFETLAGSRLSEREERDKIKGPS